MSLKSDLEFLLDTEPDTTWGFLGTWDGVGIGLSLQETAESNVQPIVCFLWVTSPKSACYLKNFQKLWDKIHPLSPVSQ